MSLDSKELSEAVRTAREAVSELEEPLKTEAFKILLERLISGGAPPGKRPHIETPVRRSRARSRAKTASQQKDRQVTPTTSSLKLDVGALKALKAYCERFELQGSEQIAFVLANFAREHTKLEYVTPADIAYLYRQLVSQRKSVV